MNISIKIIFLILSSLFFLCCASAPPNPEYMNKYVVTGKSRSELVDRFKGFDGACTNISRPSYNCISQIRNVNSSGFFVQGKYYSFDSRPTMSYDGYECYINGIRFDVGAETLALKVYGLWESIYLAKD